MKLNLFQEYTEHIEKLGGIDYVLCGIDSVASFGNCTLLFQPETAGQTASGKVYCLLCFHIDSGPSFWSKDSPLQLPVYPADAVAHRKTPRKWSPSAEKEETHDEKGKKKDDGRTAEEKDLDNEIMHCFNTFQAPPVEKRTAIKQRLSKRRIEAIVSGSYDDAEEIDKYEKNYF